MEVAGYLVALRRAATVLAALGFAALFSTGRLPQVVALVGVAALLLSMSADRGWRLGVWLTQLPRATWNVLMLMAFALLVADILWVSQDVLEAGSWYLIALMCSKLFVLPSRKDCLQLAVISLLQLLAAAVLTVDFWFAVIFVLYVVGVVRVLALSHVGRECGDEFDARSPVGVAERSGPVCAVTAFPPLHGVTVIVLLLTLVLFFIAPRVGGGFFQSVGRSGDRVSGFSETVDLGQIGAIKQDETLVMRVQLSGPAGPAMEPLYFRGAAYNYYDGRAWTNTLRRRQIVPVSGETRYRVGTQPIMTGKNQQQPVLVQDILIEASGVSVLFAAPMVDEVEGPFPALQSDPMGGLSLPYPISTRLQYTARSSPTRLLDIDRHALSEHYADALATQYLQVPHLSPRVEDLARRVTASAQTPYEKVLAVKKFLLEDYRYSLDVQNESALSPLEEFLFKRKTGYCEHYATAMVVLLRHEGVPARLVTGFLSGEWNEYGQYYAVRQRDAHAWVEVYFPHSGWVTFDATPSVGSSEPVSLWKMLSTAVDSSRLRWDQFVIRYNERDQLAIVGHVNAWRQTLQHTIQVISQELRVGLGLNNNTSGPAGESGQLGHVGLIGGLGVIVLVVSVSAWRAYGRWVEQRGHGVRGLTDSACAVVRLYRRLLQVLEQKGIRKREKMGPLEYAEWVSREWTQAGPLVTTFTETYCRVRFGGHPAASADLTHLQQLIDDLRLLPRE